MMFLTTRNFNAASLVSTLNDNSHSHSYSSKSGDGKKSQYRILLRAPRGVLKEDGSNSGEYEVVFQHGDVFSG